MNFNTFKDTIHGVWIFSGEIVGRPVPVATV